MEAMDIRDRVVETADRLYYTRGYSSVGMDELREEAGVSLRRLYSLFPSKEDIVLAVLNRRRRSWEDGVEAVEAAATTPLDKLLAVYDFLSIWFDEEDFRGCGFINAFGELGGTNPRVAELVREHKRVFQGQLATRVAELGGSPDLAAQLAILAEGAQTTAAISGSSAPALQARNAAAILIAADLG
jgi:AcrR family transcriptional regulator